MTNEWIKYINITPNSVTEESRARIRKLIDFWRKASQYEKVPYNPREDPFLMLLRCYIAKSLFTDPKTELKQRLYKYFFYSYSSGVSNINVSNINVGIVVNNFMPKT